MDSAGLNAPNWSFFDLKLNKFFHDPIPKGVPLLGDFRNFLSRHNFLWDKGNLMGFLSKNSPKN